MMRTKSIAMAVVFLLAMMAGPFASDASAQPGRSRSSASIRSKVSRAPSVSSRSLRSGSRGSMNGRSSSFRMPSSRGSSSGFNRGSSGRSSGSSGLGNLGSQLFGNGSKSNTPLLDALRSSGLGNQFNGRGGYGRGYDDPHKEYAKAHRDASIANAVAMVLTAAITSSQQCRQRQVQAAPQPTGQYVTERVLIREGHYEQYQVHIPPVYSRTTGQQVGGGYAETRTRYIPDVYDERQVWVQR